MQNERKRIAKKKRKCVRFQKQKFIEESTDDKSLIKSSNDALIQPSRPLGNASSTDLHCQPQNASPDVLQSTQFVVVDGYKVRKEYGPLVAAIFQKHGDIVKESSFSTESRWSLLELVCNIYKKLEALSVINMTHSDLAPIFGQIQDLQLVKVDVGWLRQMLVWVSERIETYHRDKVRNVALFGQKMKVVEHLEKELEEEMHIVKKLQQRLQQAKDEQSAALNVVKEMNSNYAKSLVHGLL